RDGGQDSDPVCPRQRDDVASGHARTFPSFSWRISERPPMTSMARLVSLAILTGLIVFLGITFYQIVTPFLLPLFLAAITAVWCQPLHGYFQRKFRGRDRVAAAATMTSVCILLFVP